METSASTAFVPKVTSKYFALTLATLAIGACGRDSADLRKAEVAAVDCGAARSLEAIDLPASVSLHQVTGVARLSDGRLVVANSGNHQILFLGLDHTPVTVVGRSGRGPGEFQSIDWIQALPGDSVLAFDATLQRLTVLDSHGSVARSISLPIGSTGRRAQPLGRFEDGTILARTADTRRYERTGMFRDVYTFARFAADGSFLRDLIRMPGDDYLVVLTIEGRSQQNVLLPVPFGRKTVARVFNDSFAILESGTGEVIVHTAEGLPIDSFASPWSPTPVTAQAITNYLTSITHPLTKTLAEQLDRTVYPHQTPASGDVHYDPSGRIWVSKYRADNEACETWAAIDTPEAVQLIPPGFRVLSVEHDRILGVAVQPDTDEEMLASIEFDAMASFPKASSPL